MKELFVLAMMVASGCLVQSAFSQLIDQPNRVYKEAEEDIKWLEENCSVIGQIQSTE